MEKFYLMNKDIILLEFVEPDERGNYKLVTKDDSLQRIMPTAFREDISAASLTQFVNERTVSVNRHHIEIVMGKLNLQTKFDMLRYCKGLSLTDSFWVKPTTDSSSWKDINLYTNKFDKALGWMAFTGIPSDVSKHMSTPELTTVGVLPKYWDRQGSKVSLIKGGTKDYANAGLEPISEVCASVAARLLGIDTVGYYYTVKDGYHASICQLCTTEDIGLMTADEYIMHNGWRRSRITIDEFREISKEIDYGNKKLNQLIFFDDLIRNPDRHLNNWGYFVDNNTREILRPAKIWDSGESLIAKTIPERDFPLMAASEEQFSSFGIYYKGLRKAFYGQEEQAMCYKIQTLINNGAMMKEFKERDIPDEFDDKLQIICDILKVRAKMILNDMQDKNSGAVKMSSF